MYVAEGRAYDSHGVQVSRYVYSALVSATITSTRFDAAPDRLTAMVCELGPVFLDVYGLQNYMHNFIGPPVQWTV